MPLPTAEALHDGVPMPDRGAGTCYGHSQLLAPMDCRS
jgi:hypothetical protein